jgi:hypothetical protein
MLWLRNPAFPGIEPRSLFTSGDGVSKQLLPIIHVNANAKMFFLIKENDVNCLWNDLAACSNI